MGQSLARLVVATALLLLAATAGSAADARDSKRPPWTVVGADRMDVVVLEGEAPRFRLNNTLIGPAWRHSRLDGLAAVEEGKTRVFRQEKVGFFVQWWDREPMEGRFDLQYELARIDGKMFRMRYVATPEFDTAFGIPKGADEKSVAIGPVLGPTQYFDGGSCLLTFADGTTEELPLPPPRGHKPQVVSAELRTAGGETTRLEFNPPAVLHLDNNELRCFAFQEVEAGKSMTQDVNLVLPREARFEPANRMVDITPWYPLDADAVNDLSRPSLFGMEDWQEKPAGKHGFLQIKGDRFEFEDGTPVRFWGVNPLKVDQKVNEEYLASSAAMLERLGVNLVRFHAFGKPNVPKKWAHMLKIQHVDDGLKFDPEHIALFDYGFAKMKEHGIYHGWSVIYGWYATEADKERLIDYDEATTMFAGGHWVGSFYEMTAVMPDVQDLIIQFHVNLLNRVNPYTGIRYADDPALAFIELQNEENAFLSIRNYDARMKDAPTYRRLFYKRFADWLTARYGTRESLAAAWGNALRADESLEEANITPFPVWYQGKPSRRIADQMHFIYTTQRDYYQRFERAVRETGYKGQLIGSCWQAADWVGHLYNVLSDRDIGFIDRHNYNRANIQWPGVGLLSAGFQAVIDRPFTFSEWAGGARVGETFDVPMVAIYGLGLQGWDGSMQFAWDYPGTLPHKSSGVNDTCNDFGAVAQYPLLARMVRRGDVREGAVVGNRRVSLPALMETGYVGFIEQFSLLGGANNKSFDAAVPSAALAAGRVVLEITAERAEVVHDTIWEVAHAHPLTRFSPEGSKEALARLEGSIAAPEPVRVLEYGRLAAWSAMPCWQAALDRTAGKHSAWTPVLDLNPWSQTRSCRWLAGVFREKTHPYGFREYFIEMEEPYHPPRLRHQGLCLQVGDPTDDEVAGFVHLARHFLEKRPDGFLLGFFAWPSMLEAAAIKKELQLERWQRIPEQPMSAVRRRFDYAAAWNALEAVEGTAAGMTAFVEKLQKADPKVAGRFRAIPAGALFAAIDAKLKTGALPGIAGAGEFYKDDVTLRTGLPRYALAALRHAVLHGAHPRALDASLFDEPKTYPPDAMDPDRKRGRGKANVIVQDDDYDNGPHLPITPDAKRLVDDAIWELVGRRSAR